jgi:flagellar hook-length control protein FliK
MVNRPAASAGRPGGNCRFAGGLVASNQLSRLILLTFIMVSSMARRLLRVAGWREDKCARPGGLMDFAAEPIMDAFTPPQRAVTRSNATAAESGPTFEEHLDAANETPARENAPLASGEAKLDAGVTEAKPAPNVETQPDDQIDPDVALLGGPMPAPHPQISAPVLVQIAATQLTPVQGQPADTPVAPQPMNTAPQTPIGPTPAAQAADAATPPEPVVPTAPKAAKTDATEAKGASTPAPTTAQQQAANAFPVNTQAEAAAVQTAPLATSAEPIVVHQLPEAVRQAIAASIAPTPQVAEMSQRVARPTRQTAETSAPEANAPKSAAPAAANAVVKTQTAKAVTAPAPSSDAPTVQATSGSVDTTQLAATSATTTATQASTHVQHAAAESGLQRAAPAAAQVGQEIVRRFNGGNTSFELRLDPAELGRVEVRMEVSRDHKVTAVITADNPQALTELARQARELEAQLQSAGLQLSDNGLSFDLRQGANGRGAQDTNGAQRGGGGEDASVEQTQTQTARPIGFERWRGVRVDMMV